MSSPHHTFWLQGPTQTPKVAQQEISELTILAQGLMEFERQYATTHGERTPILRCLSMVNRFIQDHIGTIEEYMAASPFEPKKTDDIPF